MSDNPKPDSRPPVQWSDSDERAMDALLKDFFRTHSLDSERAPNQRHGATSASGGARDFTHSILARLEQSRAMAPSGSNPLAVPARPTDYRRSIRWIIALAASVLALLLVRNIPQDAPQVALPRLNHEGNIAVTDSNSTPNSIIDGTSVTVEPRRSEIATGDAPATDTIASQGPAAPVKQPRRDPIVLSLDTGKPIVADDSSKHGAVQTDSIAASEVVDTESSEAPAARLNSPAQPAKLTDFNRQFTHYWQAMGVNPAPAIDDVAWRERILLRFGFQPTTSEERRGTRTALILNAEQSRMVAERVVGQLATGLKHDAARTEQLVSTAATLIDEGGRFDRWLSDWVASEVVASEPVAAATFHSAAVGQWAAGRVLGADVRCARCHDSPIDSRYNQHDYWSVAAMFTPPQSPPLFYELVDGRQRVATPGASTRWLGLTQADNGSTRLGTQQELASALVGNRQVARSLANHLWTIGFGAPLVAPTSSPIAPPRDDSIQQALEMLSDRLIANDFDIRSAIQWVIDCEPMKRGTPLQLQNDAWQVADESKLAAASLAQRSFAAARSHWPNASPSQLLAMMESRSSRQPSKLEARDSVLAQPLTAPLSLEPVKSPTGTPKQAADNQDYWWTQWLADREALRGGWMESISDRDQQIRHAFYANGHTEVTARQLQWVESLVESAGGDDANRNDTIAKIYWIIQNAR